MMRVPKRLIYGASLPSVQATDTFSGGLNGNLTARRELIIPYDGTSSWRVHLPAYRTSHPADGRVRLYDYSSEQISSNRLRLVLEYGINEEAFEDDEIAEEPGNETPIPPTETLEDGSTVTVDITRHPDFDSALRQFYNPYERRIFFSDRVPNVFIDGDGQRKRPQNAGATIPENLRGVDSYLVGTGTVTIVEYFRNRPSSVIRRSGTLDTPAGYSGANQWIVLTGRRSRSGVFWQRSLTYQYSARSFSELIYD